MKKQLKVFKTDILSIFPDKKVKINLKSSDYIERLSFDYRLEDNITAIRFEFSFVYANNALSLNYDFIKSPKKRAVKKESYSMANLTKESVLPGISSSDIDKIIAIQKFHLEDQKIIADSSLEDQMKVYLSVLKNNLVTIIEAVKSFSELN